MVYLLRRAAYGLVQLAGVSVLCFCFLELAPGDYFDTLRLNPRVSQETIENLRAQSGEGPSAVVRYGRWLVSIAHGNWGYSLAYNTPASDILWPRAANTLLLTSLGTLLAWAAGLALGLGSGIWRSTLADWLLNSLLAVLLATPDVLMALLFLLIALRSGIFPTGGLSSEAELSGFGSRAHDLANHLLLPVICLALGSLPVLAAHVRAAMIEALQMPFVRAARSYGIPTFRLVTRHVFPAAANPVISLLGLSLGGLLSSSLVVEVVFSWPGLGKLLLDSILQRDIYVVVDAVTLSSAFLLAGNFLADILLYFCDPRIKNT